METKKILEKNRFPFLLLCLLGLFLTSPLAGHFEFYRYFAIGVFYLIVLLGVYFTRGRGRPLRLITIFGILSVISAALLHVVPTPKVAYGFTFVNMTTLIATCFIILGYVFEKGAVSSDKIFAAICVYLFIGLFFGFCYWAIEMTAPGSFHLSGALTEEVLQAASGRIVGPPFNYFSFTTLTTLGYGDMTPVRSFAQNLTSIEAIIGQLYLTVLIARLVGLHIAESR